MTTEHANDNKAEEATTSKSDLQFDPTAETVTDAWEGVYINTDWGYNQTNIEFAQIIDVNDTGKTILARLVSADQVETARTSEHLRPTAEQYGEEFRLHVRNCRGDPVFRGSYPLGRDGTMEGPTRRGSFFMFDTAAEHTVRRTAPNAGH